MISKRRGLDLSPAEDRFVAMLGGAISHFWLRVPEADSSDLATAFLSVILPPGWLQAWLVRMGASAEV